MNKELEIDTEVYLSKDSEWFGRGLNPGSETVFGNVLEKHESGGSVWVRVEWETGVTNSYRGEDSDLILASKIATFTKEDFEIEMTAINKEMAAKIKELCKKFSSLNAVYAVNEVAKEKSSDEFLEIEKIQLHIIRGEPVIHYCCAILTKKKQRRKDGKKIWLAESSISAL